MNTQRRIPLLTLMIVLGLGLAGCDSAPQTENAPVEENLPTAKTLGVGKPTVAITAAGDHTLGTLRFELSNEEIPAGWTTLSLENQTHSDHFFLLYKVPQEAIDAANAANQPILEHWYETITVPFQTVWNPYADGSATFNEFLSNLIGEISTSAPWFFAPGATTMGGPGLTAAGQTSATTVHLAPGIYIAECYVKDDNEVFHSYGGATPAMLEMITVTDDESKAKEPRPTLTVQLDNTGMQIDEQVRPGMHTVAVHFDEQQVYGHLLGHNAQLVRLEDNTDAALLSELSTWMDWTKLGSFVHSSPAGTQFLGGAMEMTAGETAYVHVRLTPGDYAWIAEVPDPASKNFLKTFTVPHGQETGHSSQ